MRWAAIVCVLAGCIHDDLVHCSDGTACPVGKVCDLVQSVVRHAGSDRCTPEACDDGNEIDGDGCAHDCSSDDGEAQSCSGDSP
jgi:cysteine-rich repeat protein